MIKSLGPGLDSTDFIRIALGSQHTFIVVQNSNLSKPLVIPWPILLQQIQAQLNISSTSTIDVRDEGTIIDATAQFLNFVGAGVTVTQNGNGVDITIPGGGSGAVWGSITGTITNQTDLVTYIATALASYVPNTRTITINGTSFDLSANRTWNVGTVTGVTATAPITSSGGAAPNVSTSMNTNKLIGRGTAGVGVMEEITLGTNLSLSGTTLNATGGGGLDYGIASGTNTYTVTIAGVTSYTDGDTYVIKFTNGNDADSTININGLGAQLLVKEFNVQITGGDIVSGQELIIIYDGTNFQTLGVAPNQLFAYVTNDDSVTINKGQPVYAFGAAGNRMSVKLANNTSDATSAQTVGVVFSTSIAPNQRGFVITQGVISGVNTGAYSPGQQLYLGATAGSLTATKPYAPNHLVYIGIVERANAGNGQIYIKPMNGFELDELHNVQAQTPANNDTLYYDIGATPVPQWKTTSVNTLLNTSIKTGSCGVVFDGGGQVIQNKTAYVQVPYNGTLTSWTLVADVSGSCTITVFKDTYANFPPTTTADDVYVTAPSLSSQQKNQNLTPTYIGSQATVTAGDYIGFTISAITTITWANLTIQITKT